MDLRKKRNSGANQLSTIDFSLSIDELQSSFAKWRSDDDYVCLFIWKCCPYVLFNVSWKSELVIAKQRKFFILSNYYLKKNMILQQMTLAIVSFCFSGRSRHGWRPWRDFLNSSLLLLLGKIFHDYFAGIRLVARLSQSAGAKSLEESSSDRPPTSKVVIWSGP